MKWTDTLSTVLSVGVGVSPPPELCLAPAPPERGPSCATSTVPFWPNARGAARPQTAPSWHVQPRTMALASSTVAVITGRCSGNTRAALASRGDCELHTGCLRA